MVLVQKRAKPNYVPLFKSVSPEGKDELWVLQPGLIFSKGLTFNVSLRDCIRTLWQKALCACQDFSWGCYFKASFI